MSKKVTVQLTINKKTIKEEVSPQRSLADFLHEKLGLTGTKVCCGMGVCKACTVAVKREGENKLERAQSCITPVASLSGSEITTVEGLSEEGKPNKLQQAFLKEYSFQCGFSTAGFLMGATLLMDELKRQPVKKSELDSAIEKSLGEHVCRCTGYVRYYKAIKETILSTPGLTTA
ncbi:(2Fe-2S)-binding protein [Pseudobacteriovorax antillogorgiicola]|uniref:Aerobic-type carbon monoxide dehydrogenase, small subunit, CoxS/CutS family n=1 Tax=Pseudobacteriovorax antillogorgiicola TaxID=1513793 RepID=A0A1Y6CY02_9BACT|nr:2Fe-2S iron-sulfur cluster-binding protein [Pseudobacteriovorax antillogorgiicola]TCS42728.1 aerobic-type carbon monoxide dehydrogenase small subunit (CoxS/CutS family) [Pseudobacteriovorax antillogorgiicola]SMF82397.1 Aerobic-type carbon monoxide dehydrogenase, small subunit, CoxS/CutS family [Pseudobacteriovorax antillogorgiicola]